MILGLYTEESRISEMLREYEVTLKNTRVILRDLSAKMKTFRAIYENKSLPEDVRKSARISASPISEDISIIKSWESNLVYSLTWMRTGRRPGSTRGAERRAAYEREIPFENQWIQRRQDRINEGQEVLGEEVEVDEFDLEMKVELTVDIKKELTPRQIEVMELLGRDIEQPEIAEMLGITQQAVSKAIIRSKEKIKQAGWIMV